MKSQRKKFAVEMLGNENLKASNGWLVSFRGRDGIAFQSIVCDKKFAPLNITEPWK